MSPAPTAPGPRRSAAGPVESRRIAPVNGFALRHPLTTLTGVAHPPYVSDDLVHFVGRGATSDEEAFDRLVTIIRGSWLQSLNAVLRGERDENASTFEIKLGVPLSSNERYVPEMICFADIPEEALQIHTAKYRRFGLAFRKNFAISKGARPMLYVPFGARAEPMAQKPDVSDDWNDLVTVFQDEVDPLFGGRTASEPVGHRAEWPATRIADWVGHELLAFMKFYDPNLADDDPENYYMEREWRTLRSVEFEVEDIARVYVASGFKERLSAEFPQLEAKVCEL